MIRVGQGFDVHRHSDDPARVLMLGGCAFDGERGLDGHSDADVLLHAIADALLGAAGLGDIGESFPDTDPQFKDADSGALLIAERNRVRERGWQISNLDCTVAAQRPKLSPYKSAIRARIADLLQIPGESVNVKAKTGENVGPVGREEAMTAEAIVLLTRHAAP